MDRFTRWIELIPVKGDKNGGELSAESTLDKFRANIIDRFGAPLKLLTDNATCFKGAFAEFCREHKIELLHGMPYKHDTNGMVERNIRTIHEALRHYVNGHVDNWDANLTALQASLNSHQAWGPKATPYFLNMGKERRPLINNDLLQPLVEKDLPLEQDDLSAERGEAREAQQELIDEAAAAQNTSSQRSMGKGRGGTRGWTPKAGDWIMVRRPTDTRKSKMEPIYDGPYALLSVDVRGNCAYADPVDPKREVGTAHIRSLSQYKGEKFERPKFLPSEFIDLRPLVQYKSKKVRNQTREFAECQGIPVDQHIDPASLIGLRVEVFWNQPSARGWWKGSVVGYDPKTKSFRVRYDVASGDGEDTYEEGLLSPTMPKWKVIPLGDE